MSLLDRLGIHVNVRDEYKRVANSYNLRHPERKISWRRLNRHQRSMAILTAAFREGKKVDKG